MSSKGAKHQIHNPNNQRIVLSTREIRRTMHLHQYKRQKMGLIRKGKTTEMETNRTTKINKRLRMEQKGERGGKDKLRTRTRATNNNSRK